MIRCGHWPVGLCSWSLQTEITGVAKAMAALGSEHIHLDVGPACAADPEAYLDQVKQQGWTISATMIGFPQEDYTSLDQIRLTGGIVPDAEWPANRERFIKALDATVALGVPYLTSHFGFIDHTQPDYAKVIAQRLQELADAAQERGITILMETGQETAEDLKIFLEGLGHKALGVNFDPANMILYNKGNPIEAVNTLAPWIKHVHIKDANKTLTPGTWGEEVVWGRGQVQDKAFIRALERIHYQGVLAIEREGGDRRQADIRTAIYSLIDTRE